MAGRKAAGIMNTQQENGMSAGWVVLGWHEMGVHGRGGTPLTLVSSSRDFPLFVDGSWMQVKDITLAH